MSSEPKVGPESDTDSMAEYGDGDTGNFQTILRCVCLYNYICFYKILI